MAAISTIGSGSKDTARMFNKGHLSELILRMKRSGSNAGNHYGYQPENAYSDKCTNGCSRDCLRDNVKYHSLPTQITIVTENDVAPFISQTGNNPPTGFDVDLINQICQLLQISFKYEYSQFLNFISAVQNDSNVISISTEFDTVAREQSVNFVDYFRTGSIFLVRSNCRENINGLSDLCGKTVVVEDGSTQQGDVQQQNAKCGGNPINIQSVSTLADLVNAVESGSADVGVYDKAVLTTTVSQSYGKLALVGQEYGVAPYGILCNKGNQALCCALTDAINYLIGDGTYERLLNKYSFTFKANGVCPSRVNLNGPTCSSTCKPSNSFCQAKLH